MELNFLFFCDLDLSWRKRKRYNSEDILDVMNTTSNHLPQPPQETTHRSAINGCSRPFYITLAKETPPRCRTDENEDSEDSMYDSFHGRETGTAILKKLFIIVEYIVCYGHNSFVCYVVCVC